MLRHASTARLKRVTQAMSQDHRLQHQRFELKYLVEESLMGHIRDFVSGYLELDEYAVGQPNFSYPVHSLYLDSEGMHTHHAWVNGTKNRFKLRLRYYDDRPDSPVFFEVKGRVDNCILKRRCGVRRDAVVPLLNGQWPRPEQFITREPRHFAALSDIDPTITLRDPQRFMQAVCEPSPLRVLGRIYERLVDHPDLTASSAHRSGGAVVDA